MEQNVGSSARGYSAPHCPALPPSQLMKVTTPQPKSIRFFSKPESPRKRQAFRDLGFHGAPRAGSHLAHTCSRYLQDLTATTPTTEFRDLPPHTDSKEGPGPNREQMRTGIPQDHLTYPAVFLRATSLIHGQPLLPPSPLGLGSVCLHSAL